MANEQDALLPDENGTTRATPFDPNKHGVWRSMVGADGKILDGKWETARRDGSFVGTCRRCGSYLRPRAPEEINGRTDYEATCINMVASTVLRGGVQTAVPCAYAAVAPNGVAYRDASPHRRDTARGR